MNNKLFLLYVRRLFLVDILEIFSTDSFLSKADCLKITDMQDVRLFSTISMIPVQL